MNNEIEKVKVHSNFLKTEKGRAIVKKAKIEAINMVFDMPNGQDNKDVAKELGPELIYDAIMLSSALVISVDKKPYVLNPYWDELDDRRTVDLLSETQSRLEICLAQEAMNQPTFLESKHA